MKATVSFEVSVDIEGEKLQNKSHEEIREMILDTADNSFISSPPKPVITECDIQELVE